MIKKFKKKKKNLSGRFADVHAPLEVDSRQLSNLYFFYFILFPFPLKFALRFIPGQVFFDLKFFLYVFEFFFL